MRIVVDLQGAQNESRFRGIGRYSLSLARAMAQRAGAHEIWIALNARFPESLDDIAKAFDGLLPPERLCLFSVPGPLKQIPKANGWRVRAAEIAREQFLAQLRPDVVHISSWFEGPWDDTVASIDSLRFGIPQAATLYDLIPLLRPDTYLAHPEVRSWYFRKAQTLRQADLLLAISQSSADEAREKLFIPDRNIVTIGAGVDELFSPPPPDPARDAALRRQYVLDQPFIMYTGAADPRKNLTTLLRAVALLPEHVRAGHVLACAGKIDPPQKAELFSLMGALGLRESSVRFLGYIPDADLVRLYAMCELFVFPSIHEGFGLPAVEAMACGAAVIGSNTTSVPSVIGRSDALFDPNDAADIARCATAVLSSHAFQADLRAHGRRRAAAFRWDEVGRRAIGAFEALHEKQARPSSAATHTTGKKSLAVVSPRFDRSGGNRGLSKVVGKLAREYDVTWISNTPAFWPTRSLRRVAVRKPEWFRENGFTFDRILYVVANHASYHFVLPLLESWPGVVLLPQLSTARAVHAVQGGVTVDADTAVYDSHGLPALLSAESRGAEWPCNEAVFRLSDGVLVYDAAHVIGVDTQFGASTAERMRVVPAPQSVGQSARAVATAWMEAVEALSQGAPQIRNAALKSISAIELPDQAGDLDQISAALGENSPRFGLPQILVDVSTIERTDARTGIQRVVRSILSELVRLAPPGWRIEPVRVDDEGYVYARDFAARSFALPPGSLPPDEPVETRRGDVFLGLDLIAHLLAPKRRWFETQLLRGMEVTFVVYDLLPLRRPEAFPPNVPPVFQQWSAVVGQVADRVICISRAVADEFSLWMAEQSFARRKPLQIRWFHLGADLEASLPTAGLPADAQQTLEVLKSRPFFLSVGTLEPRKRHGQMLDAFELLWGEGVNAGLVIVGQPGWRTEDLGARIRAHPELGHRLFWLRGISDEMLTQVYKSCTCLLLASEAEGFGLPLTEAARHHRPVLARDLPVFREVGRDGAAYFSGEDGRSLAEAIRNWLALFAAGMNPRPERILCQTWNESARQLLERLDITSARNDSSPKQQSNSLEEERHPTYPVSA